MYPEVEANLVPLRIGLSGHEVTVTELCNHVIQKEKTGRPIVQSYI